MVWGIDLKILMMGWSNVPPPSPTKINVVINILCSQIFISNIQVKFKNVMIFYLTESPSFFKYDLHFFESSISMHCGMRSLH